MAKQDISAERARAALDTLIDGSRLDEPTREEVRTVLHGWVNTLDRAIGAALAAPRPAARPAAARGGKTTRAKNEAPKSSVETGSQA